MKQHILIIYLGSRGGGPVDTYEICESLCKVGKNSYSLIISENNPLKEKYKSLPLNDVFVFKTHKVSQKDFILRSIFPIRIIPILRTIKKIKPSIIFFTMTHPWLVFILFYIKLFMPKTLVFFIKHNPSDFESVSASALNKLLDKIEGLIVRNSDCIFTLSQFVKDEIIKRYNLDPSKVFSFNLGAHHSICDKWKHSGFFKDGILRLLFFGRILNYKGVDTLVEAYEIMKKNNLPVELTIAGEGYIDNFLLEKIEKLGIKMLNYWISEEELCQLLSETDVVVLPYKRASQSGPASIALALGIPVIATQVGGLVEQVYDGINGILIKPNCPEDIVSAVKRILADPSILASFSKGAISLGKEALSWDNIAFKMDEIFSQYGKATDVEDDY